MALALPTMGLQLGLELFLEGGCLALLLLPILLPLALLCEAFTLGLLLPLATALFFLINYVLVWRGFRKGLR